MVISSVLLLFFILIFIRTPIYLILGLIGLLLFMSTGEPLIGFSQIMIDHLNSDTLISIPFFMMAAALMSDGGIAKALIDCAQVWVGRLRGGLSVVCVLATTVFAAISGSSVATAMAMGAFLIPVMTANGYDRKFSLGIVAASGTLGILIPPSLAFIVYAILAEESVPKLFLAGIIPGLLQAILFISISLFIAYKNKMPKGEKISKKEFIGTNIRALPALIIPMIVLGGIYTGTVGVTEAAALSAFIALIISRFFYDKRTMAHILETLFRALKNTASIVYIILSAMLISHWITTSGIADQLVEIVIHYHLKSWQFLLLVNLLLLAMGSFLEVFAVMLIAVPILLPLLKPLGIDPIHFAVVITMNMELALLTPPIGLNLFVLSSVSNAPINDVIRGVIPFILGLGLLLILITYVPELSLWLPNLLQ